MKILDAILNEYHYPDKSPYVNIAEGVLIFTRVTLGRKMYQYYPENQRFRQIHERHDPLLFKIFCCVYAILAAPLALIAAAVKLANTKNRQIHQLFLDTNRAPPPPPPRVPVPSSSPPSAAVVAAADEPQTCVICLEPIGNDPFINGSNQCNHQLHMQCFRNAEQAAQRNLNFADPANPNAWDPDYSGCPTCRAGSRPRPVRPNHIMYFRLTPIAAINDRELLTNDEEQLLTLVSEFQQREQERLRQWLQQQQLAAIQNFHSNFQRDLLRNILRNLENRHR